MTENKKNVVDADVEVLDLDELSEAVGGSSLADAIARVDLSRLQGDLGDIRRATSRPATFDRGAVLIENDGWQGKVYDISPVLIENDGWQ